MLTQTAPGERKDGSPTESARDGAPAEAPASSTTPSRATRLAQYMELTKARLSALVIVTAGVGYLIAPSSGAPFDWVAFALTVVGVALAAGGTSAINQWMEVERDARMPRTADRPLPSGAMSRGEALGAGSAMVAAGAAIIFFGVNPVAGFLTIFTAAVYVLVYTPLKPRTTLNTLVGAVCGATPPMIGWAAATGGLELGAWILGGILFVWQLPHFLALAWMYRDDYAQGGFRMLPIVDPTGLLTARVVLVTTLLMVPVSLMATLAGVAGYAFALTALLLGAFFIERAIRMVRDRSRASARGLFLASIIYLPLLMGALVADRTPGAPSPADAAINAATGGELAGR